MNEIKKGYGRRYSQQEKTAIVEAYKAGATYREIEERFGTNSSTITSFLRRVGLYKEPRKITDNESQEMITLYLSGKTSCEIAKIFDVSAVSVQARLKKAGVTRSQAFNIKDHMQVIKDYKSGVKISELVKRYKKNKTTIYKILRHEFDFAPPKRLSESAHAAIVKDYSLGMTTYRVAAKYNISQSVALDIVKQAGINRKPKRINEDQKRQAINLYASGMHLKHVGERLGISGIHVKRICKAANVEIRPYKGENNFMWKGGRTSLALLIRASKKYIRWRLAIFRRDKFVCQHCKIDSKEKLKTLQADHKIPFAKILEDYDIKTLDDANKCELLWDISNGQTLCAECHKKTPTWANGTKKLLRRASRNTKHPTPIQ